MSKKISHRSATSPGGSGVGAAVDATVRVGSGVGTGDGDGVGVGRGVAVATPARLGAGEDTLAAPGSAATITAPPTMPRSASNATTTPGGVVRADAPADLGRRVDRGPSPRLPAPRTDRPATEARVGGRASGGGPAISNSTARGIDTTEVGLDSSA